jgi:hypothetical protein
MKKSFKGLVSFSLVILFSFIFVGCDQDNNSKKTEDARLIFEETEYEVYVGDELTLNPIKEGKINDIKYQVKNTSVISCDENGVITALKEGTSYLDIIVNEDLNSKITLKIIVEAKVPVIDVGNVDDNRRVYNELLSEITSFSNKMDNSNFLTFTIQVENDGETNTQIIKAMNEPMYLAVEDGFSSFPTVIQEEDGKIFEYTFNDSININRKYLQAKDDFIPTDDYEMDTESLLHFTFNPERGHAKKVGNTYTFQAYYRDALDETSKEIMEELYKALGLTTTKLYHSIVIISYTLSEHQMTITNTLNLELEVNNRTIPLNMDVSYNISTQEFTKIDFNDPKYQFSKPTCFEEVRESTDFNQPYTIDQYGTDYLKVSLEKGQYVITDHESFYSNFNIEIYDLEQNKIPSALNISSGYMNQFNFTFMIPESKEYFVKLKNGISVERMLTFNKLDYETLFDLDHPKEMTHATGTIEGEWDFEYYEYQANDTEIMKLTNAGEHRLYLIANQYGNGYNLYQLEPSQHLYLKVTEGVNKFYISNHIGYQTKAYDYAFHVETIENNNGSESNFDQMESITEEYSEKLFMAGYGLEDKYLKLIVNTQGRYEFEFDCIEPGMSLQVGIMKRSGENIISNGYNSFAIEPGEYIVRITNNDHIFGIGKIKYNFRDSSDKDVEVELPKADLKDIYSDSFTDLKNQKVVTTQKIKYYFTLTEDSTLVYDETHMFIYDQDGKQLSLSPTYYAYQTYGLIELKAGRYYFTTPNMYSDYSLPLKIAIVEQERDSWQDLNQMKVLNVGDTLNLNKDWQFDKEYFQITIDERGTYLLSNGFYYVIDENFNSIYLDMINGGKQFEAEVGTYYVIYIYGDFETTTSISLRSMN